MSSLNKRWVRPARRFFILGLVLIDTVAIGLGVYALLAGTQLAVGLGLGAAVSTGFITYITLWRPARTTRNPWWIPVVDIISLVVALISWPVVLPIVAAAAGMHLLYIYWYSRLNRSGSTELQVGRRLPEFVLTSVSGEQTSSSELRKQPRIILFYRGNWCPLCVAQIRELAAAYNELEQRGYRVTLISPQPSKNTEDIARRFNVNFDFYSDIGGKAADILGIKHIGGTPAGVTVGYDGDTVLPTVLITDDTGTIRWLDLTDNYRVRPEPSTFIEVIDSFEASSTRAVSINTI